LVTVEGRLLRLVFPSGLENLRAWLGSSTIREFTEHGRAIRAHTCSSGAELPGIMLRDYGSTEDVAAVMEQEKIWFPSYPSEWPAEMLYAAGLLTLDLADALLPEGLGLKDATAYNVLFRGAQPTFVDMLSIERREPTDPVWLPCSQFLRHFILPLLANYHLGLPLREIFAAHSDGIPPEAVYANCGFLQRLHPGLLTSVSIPVWLSTTAEADPERTYGQKRAGSPEQARFILRHLLNRLRKKLTSCAPTADRRSFWSAYTGRNQSYSEAEFAQKQQFLEATLTAIRPRRVLDLGCNTGRFSLLAAGKGGEVVAVDSDPVAVGMLWRAAVASNYPLLPLVVDLSSPTPASGWRNQERASFLGRARGQFDVILLLALLHHLVIGHGIPLASVVELAAELTTKDAVIEFISAADPMARRLVRGRGGLFAGYTREAFEQACTRHFRILRAEHMATRSLYWLSRE
jgi:SAM-dependent methyltransferase